MSQYGYIPKQNISSLQQEYNIANPSTWRFVKDTVEYGGVEDNEFTEAQKEEITSLGGGWFESAYDFNQWLNKG